MRILIIGDGKVGHSLAAEMIGEGHDVTIIDRDEVALQRSMDTLDALVVKGSGVSVPTLTEADAQHADIVVAVTVSDEINMLSCLTAKKLGARYTIARIRDPEYLESLPFIQKELAIDYPINPERKMALEISRLLRYPFTGNIETFARGRVEMMDFRVTQEDGLAGIALRDLFQQRRSLPQVLLCAVEREQEAFIPRGDYVIREGDRIYVTADIATITAFFRALGKNTLSVHRVMILGGSRIAFYLASMLLEMKMKVSIIEIDPDKARALSEMLPGASVIAGDGTDQELLQSEGLMDSDAFVTLSGRDEENIMAGLFAVRSGVRKVVVKNNRDSYTELLGTIGLESIVSTKRVTSHSILRTVRTRSGIHADQGVERVFRLMDGKAEALELVVRKGSDYLHKPLQDLAVRDNALIAVIVRDGRVRIPFGRDTLEEDDHVIVIAKGSGIHSLEDILEKSP